MPSASTGNAAVRSSACPRTLPGVPVTRSSRSAVNPTIAICARVPMPGLTPRAAASAMNATLTRRLAQKNGSPELIATPLTSVE